MSSNYSVLNQDLDNILELRSNWYFPSQGDTQWFGFGQNNFNIFGSENSPNVYTPSPVTRLINFTKISTGCFHTAGIDANGHLWMWGNNDCGQLGLGDTTNRIAPTQLGTDTWIEVAAGAQHTLAIQSDTSLWVWGRNQDFELGTGTSDWGNHPNSLVPIQPSFYGTS